MVSDESSVVRVIATGGPGAWETGSGFVVGQNRILTNQHVVGSSGLVTVVFRSGVGRNCPVIGASHPRDLALLNCSTGRLPILQLSNQPYVGEKIAALGHPGGGPLRVSEGSVTNATPDAAGYVTIDAQLAPGSSGGPVIDTSTGKVIGVASALDPDVPGVDFAIPDATLEAFLQAPPVPAPAGPSSNWFNWGWALLVGVILGLAVGYTARSKIKGASRLTRGPGDALATLGGVSVANGEPTVILHERVTEDRYSAGHLFGAAGGCPGSGSELGIVLHPTQSQQSSMSGSNQSPTHDQLRTTIEVSTDSGHTSSHRITVEDP